MTTRVIWSKDMLVGPSIVADISLPDKLDGYSLYNLVSSNLHPCPWSIEPHGFYINKYNWSNHSLKKNFFFLLLKQNEFESLVNVYVSTKSTGGKPALSQLMSWRRFNAKVSAVLMMSNTLPPYVDTRTISHNWGLTHIKFYCRLKINIVPTCLISLQNKTKYRLLYMNN